MEEKIDGFSMDIEKNEREKLKEIFPMCFTEGDKLDIDKLLNMCGSYITDDYEKYEFKWKGKSECLQTAQRQSNGTLRPYPNESKNFDVTNNIYIEGDNLEVIKLLQKSYYKKVKMIYIDPPYNTGNDFIYEDDFKMPIERYKEVISEATKSNPESMGRFHTNWLNMMYPRLRLAHNLLRDDGVMFISIDDNEVHNLRKLCDEVFGEENFVGEFSRVTKKSGKSSDYIAKNNDFLIVYSKSNNLKLYLPSHTDDGFKHKDEYFEQRGLYKLNQTLDYDSLQYSKSLDYEIIIDGEKFYAGQSYEKHLERQNGIHARADWAWRWSKELFQFGLDNGFIVVKKYDNYSRIYTKTYQNATISKNNKEFFIEIKERTRPISTLEFIDNRYSNDNAKKDLVSTIEHSVFDYSKPVAFLKDLVKYATSDNDIILDFFSGSATTAHAVMELNAEDGGNRQFIMVQIPELCDEKSEAYKSGYKNICEIGKERIRRAGDKIVSEKKDILKERETPLDIGFKVLKLDTSNFKLWDTSPIDEEDGLLLVNELERRFSNMTERTKPNRSDLEIIFELMLKLGFPLNSKIEPIEINDKVFYEVSTTFEETFVNMIICLDKGITSDDVIEIMDYTPAKIIFGEDCFVDFNELTNARIELEKEDFDFMFV